MRKLTISLTLVVLFILALAAWWMLRRQNTTSPSTNPTTAVSQPITISGTYVCLPHRDSSGPQTLECALGLQADSGVYYALNTSNLSAQNPADFTTGDRLTITGELTPAEQLDVDNRLLNYDITGVILVTTMNSETTSPEQPVTDSTSINGITFSRPDNFGLAVNQDQILVESSVPPCSQGFDYCLYYNDSEYENTNFETAGVRIQQREDLSTADDCLTTEPSGYSDLSPEITERENYTTSVFSDLGDSGAGHSTQSSVYRLSFDTTCYEFETRIATSQFENAEEGSIKEFTEEDRQNIQNQLMNILRNVRLSDMPNEVLF